MKYIFKVILTGVFLCSGFYGFSQEQRAEAILVDQYTEALKLDNKQKRKLKNILLKNASRFNNVQLNNQDYNTLLKKEHLEIYEILNEEQFYLFKKDRLSIEPNKNYRFKKTNE